MKQLQNMLLIGGTGRNIGKTTLMEMLIKQFSTGYRVIALKSSMLLPGEEHFHGKHKIVKPDEYILKRELSEKGGKDSQRYLMAGATQSFFLSVGEKVLNEAFEQFLKYTDGSEIIIAESNVLRNVINPGLFIMVQGKSKPKPYAVKLLELADIIVPSLNIKRFEKVIGSLKFDANGWHLI